MSSKELWRILMLKPNLETLDISVLTGVPISLLTSQGRGNLPKIKSLSICRAQATLQDLIFLKDEVSSDTHVSSVTFKSDSEIAEFIKKQHTTSSWLSRCPPSSSCSGVGSKSHGSMDGARKKRRCFLICELIGSAKYPSSQRNTNATPTPRIFEMIVHLHQNNTSNKKKNRPTVGQLRKLYKRLYGTHIPALNNEKNLKELLEEDPEERPDFDIALAGGQTRFFFTHDGLARRYEKMANYSIFKDVDNILIIAAEFIFELAQNTQFSIAPNVLVAPFSAIRATLMFLIIGSTDPPQNKAFWFVFILLSSCFLHNITAKVFLCTVTCNGNVETKKYEYMGHWLCSDMWSSSPRCP
ncbi:hypothetical protein QR680_014813 [Steinernema hermaphroditum]|uniref:Uncharacterized protein n=1 Tax=Steinernema hermaphroditum TaxID=289476 RepID=A0AA39IA72_9BILA|nr:hypothetical protein QR680_014813 [Steinernema hermaphroditum]